MNRPDGQAVTGETLTIQVYREPTYIIVTALGEIDIATVGRLRERLFDLASSGRPLVVDLNYVNLVDAAGLGALVGASRRATTHGTALYVVCARRETQRLFQQAGLNRQIPIARTVDEAVHALTANLNTPASGGVYVPGAQNARD